MMVVMLIVQFITTSYCGFLHFVQKEIMLVLTLIRSQKLLNQGTSFYCQNSILTLSTVGFMDFWVQATLRLVLKASLKELSYLDLVQQHLVITHCQFLMEVSLDTGVSLLSRKLEDLLDLASMNVNSIASVKLFKLTLKLVEENLWR